VQYLVTKVGLPPATRFNALPRLLSIKTVEGSFLLCQVAFYLIGRFDDRKRAWIPKISSPGKPNDYINLFLDELKTWLRTQLTLDTVHADELARRGDYFTKLKHDNFYWCFPPESGSSSNQVTGNSGGVVNYSFNGTSNAAKNVIVGGGSSIHEVIDFVHNKVNDALEVVTREEKNKSLQLMFKEMNDHSMNAFEYGKNFLAFMLTTTPKVGSDFINSSNQYDGSSVEKGRLHCLLLSVTVPVFQSYVTDMKDTALRIENGSGVGYGAANAAILNGTGSNLLMFDKPSNNMDANSCSEAGTAYRITVGANGTDNQTNMQRLMSAAPVYTVTVSDPDSNVWTVSKTTNEFKAFHQSMMPYLEYLQMSNRIELPALKQTVGVADTAVYTQDLSYYLIQMITLAPQLPVEARKLFALFLNTKQLVLPSPSLVLAERLPNVFLDLRQEFKNYLVQSGSGLGAGDNACITADNKPCPSSQVKQTADSTSRNSWSITSMMSSLIPGGQKETANTNASKTNSNACYMEKDFALLRNTWGIAWTHKILDAYAHLQRMSALLSWTLELNYFFISMFGNTIAFSKLPLREILATQKEIVSNFLSVANELYKYSCQLNSEQQYKWHKNLQLAENQLTLLRHHADMTVNVITKIENEHLDYDTQLKRLQDVASRFQPFMSRVVGSIENIQSELGLRVHSSNSSSYQQDKGYTGNKGYSNESLPKLTQFADGSMQGGNSTALVPLAEPKSLAYANATAPHGGAVIIEEIDTVESKLDLRTELPTENKGAEAKYREDKGEGSMNDNKSSTVCVIS
jgi:hypothetical protein